MINYIKEHLTSKYTAEFNFIEKYIDEEKKTYYVFCTEDENAIEVHVNYWYGSSMMPWGTWSITPSRNIRENFPLEIEKYVLESLSCSVYDISGLPNDVVVDTIYKCFNQIDATLKRYGSSRAPSSWEIALIDEDKIYKAVFIYSKEDIEETLRKVRNSY